MVKRTVTQWSEREFVINRYNIWFGSDMPKTISAKELIDNGLDQIADSKASNVNITLDKNFISIMDDGKGISTRKAEGGKTHLFLAVNKLYTSSNYDGTDGLAGTNGVGATATNALSSDFKAGYIKENVFKGYLFNNGEHKDDGESLDTIEDMSMFPNKLDEGFYVEANYDNQILEDDINVEWLINYTRSRVGELPENSNINIHAITQEGKENYNYNKFSKSKDYVPSWEEAVNKVTGSSIISVRGGWKFAFCGPENDFEGISSIVQGAPVKNPITANIPFEVQDSNISIRVPVTFKFKGKVNPKYTDQTKQRISMKRAQFEKALKADKELYKEYYNKAEKEYLNKTLDDSKSSMYYPAAKNSDYKELIISEGFSAVSSIKSKRKYQTQACFALRGKLLNVMQKDLKSAMKSDVIRDLINILNNNNFDKIIITPDADADGAHICTLLLGVLSKYGTEYLKQGKVYYCKTPLYVFEKGKDIKWSDNVNDKPKGYKLSVKKGLGSLTPQETRLFITDFDSRELYRFTYDGDEDLRSLEFALIEGGKGWIVE